MFSRIVRAISAVALYLLMTATMVLPAAAQQPADGTPAVDAGSPAPGARQDANGSWFMTESESEPVSADLATAAAGGPDQYGYTWSTATFDWIDAVSGGTDTGLSGNSEDNATNLIPLPFAFKYFENVYNAVYIAASGYLAFADLGDWPSQFRPLRAPGPNNVISVYPSPLRLSQNTGNGRVYYKFGGTAPNRYLVVEWYKVRDYWDDDDSFTFEVILFENGNISFQYHTMTYVNGYYCGSGAIEDATGMDGVLTSAFCERINSSTAVRIVRPATGARINVYPLADGSFTYAAAAQVYPVRIRNVGDNGADRYNLTVNSPWDVRLVDTIGAPLHDSNGDGTQDTGVISFKGEATIRVVVESPPIVTAGESAQTTVTFRSVNNPAVQRTVTIRTTVPHPFAQVFAIGVPAAPKVMINRPTVQTISTLASSSASANDVAVASMPGLGYAVAWREWDNGYALYARMTDLTGTARTGKLLVAGVNNPDYEVGHWEPALASSPDGHVAIAWWTRLEKWDGSDWLYNENVWLAILDSAGNITKAPTRLTSNNAFGTFGTVGLPFYDSVSIAATANDRFVVAWESQVNQENSYDNDVEYAVFSTSGSVVRGLTRYSDTAERSMGNAWNPVVATINGGQVFLTFGDGEVQYTLLSNDGAILQPQRAIAYSGYQYYLDAAPIGGGNVLITWYTFRSQTYNIGYAVLNATTFTLVKEPSEFNRLSERGEYGAAIAPLAAGGAVITYSGDDDTYLGAAAVSSNGTVLAQPAIFQRATLAELTAGDYFRRSDWANHSAAVATLPTTQLKSDPTVTSTSLAGGPQGATAGLGINVLNNGLQPATGLVLTADLPDEVGFISSTPAPSSIIPASATGGETITWMLPNLSYLDGGRVLMATTVPSTTVGATWPVQMTLTTTAPQLDPDHGKDTTQLMEMRGIWLPLVRE